jgi:hypothetical protein
MDTDLVELYLPRREEAGLKDAAARARLASEQLTSEGEPVRYLRTIFVPEDEICFHLYEAGAAGLVAMASLRAQNSYERIVRAVSLDRSHNDPRRERKAP